MNFTNPSLILPEGLTLVDFSDNVVSSRTVSQIVSTLSGLSNLDTLTLHQPGVSLEEGTSTAFSLALQRTSNLRHEVLIEG